MLCAKLTRFPGVQKCSNRFGSAEPNRSHLLAFKRPIPVVRSLDTVESHLTTFIRDTGIEAHII